MKTYRIDKLTCSCEAADSSHTIYFLSPLEIEQECIESLAHSFHCNLVVVTGIDWDNDMTPWKAPGVAPDDPEFEGLAPQFLELLTSKVIPAIEAEEGFAKTTLRDLVGISLSGLFALWAWLNCSDFNSIASISGSFWYDGFLDYLRKKLPEAAPRDGMAYFALGVNETTNKVQRFKDIATATSEIVLMLRHNHIRVVFEWNRGNHYSPVVPRLEKALLSLTTRSV